MGQKVHPTGARLGIIKDWSSKWYADDNNFANYLVEDQKIRKFLKKKEYEAGISKIEIERTAKMVKVNIYTAKPGILIGKGGAGIEALKEQVKKEDYSEILSMIQKDYPEMFKFDHLNERLNIYAIKHYLGLLGIVKEKDRVINASTEIVGGKNLTKEYSEREER